MAGLPKESLSRLRRRSDCDLATLERLAQPLGLRLEVAASNGPSPDRHMPGPLTRLDEERLHKLVRSGDLTPAAWRTCGPPFFMAGLALLLAGPSNAARPRLLRLAEELHPGITEPAVANLWLQRTPLEPSRFFAQLEGASGDT
jgi:hypothetical protein